MAIAKTRDEYAVRVIEQALMPAKKSEPKRAIICLVVTLFGTFVFVLVMAITGIHACAEFLISLASIAASRTYKYGDARNAGKNHEIWQEERRVSDKVCKQFVLSCIPVCKIT